MDYWMHTGILFSCQEIYSVVRKFIPLTVPFFITVQRHNSDFRIHTPVQLRWTDGGGWGRVLSDPSLSAVTVCTCKWLISAAMMSTSNYHHMALVSKNCMGFGARVLVRFNQIWLLPEVVTRDMSPMPARNRVLSSKLSDRAKANLVSQQTVCSVHTKEGVQ